MITIYAKVALNEFEKLNKELNINSEIYLHMLRKYNNHFSNINFVDDELEEMIRTKAEAKRLKSADIIATG